MVSASVRWVLTLGVAVVVVAQLGACGEVISLSPEDASAGIADGETCGTSTECASGHCSDSVCCDHACDGICESCIVKGSKGSCAPVGAGDDPRSQCGPVKADVADGGTDDGGTPLNLPDGGVNLMNAKCGGSCDGHRACAYPGAAKSCGASFCNTANEVALSRCDGQGHCGIEPEACVGYTCGPNACKTQCVANADCDSGHFCNTLGQCQPQKSQGTNCATLAECTTGFCSNGVCCNTDCSLISGGDCDKPGFVGQCKCAPGGVVCNTACKAYYPDLDGDGFGDHKGLAVAGCGDTPPMPNYVSNNDDCYDAPNASKPNAKLAFPKSTFSQGAHRGDGSFDYDCDGVETKAYVERPGASCGGCGSPIAISKGYVCASPDTAVCTTSTASTASRFLACDLAYNNYFGTYNCVGRSGFLICPKGQVCYSYDQVGYNSIVPCGQFGTYIQCGACNGAGGVDANETVASRQQICH